MMNDNKNKLIKGVESYDLSLNDGNVVCLEFDKKLISVEELSFFVNKIKNDLPKNVNIIVIPNSINAKTMNKKQLKNLLNQIQNILNKSDKRVLDND